ncbi:MAG: hypothetical protein LBK57_03790 [Clostridiales Family XIII bacterium]|nr:hypothetical protein [Clostridiales Family XIII bacterium]
MKADSKKASDAARIGAEAALDFYAKEKQKEKRRRADRRLRDTKRLMRNYREIKIHAGDAIASLSEVGTEDFDFFQLIMEDRAEIDVSAIVVSRAKSAVILTHISAMVEAYKVICAGSKKPEDMRRYRVLDAFCLTDDPLSARELADRENVDTRTIYKDFDIACEKMSALLFGIQWIERE